MNTARSTVILFALALIALSPTATQAQGDETEAAPRQAPAPTNDAEPDAAPEEDDEVADPDNMSGSSPGTPAESDILSDPDSDRPSPDPGFMPADAENEPDEDADEDDEAEADDESDADDEDGPDGADDEDGEEEEDGLTFGARISGEYRHRFVMMSEIPLQPLPRTDAQETGRLGQNYWGEQWLRLRGEITLAPVLRVFGEADLLWGVAYGDTAIGQRPAAWPRDEYGYPGLRLRQLYLEWLTPIGLLRAGQMSFSWGLGIISNGGEAAPVFGDARYGDLVRRLLFATKPAGADSPFTIAISGDWVAWDLIADFESRDDLAFQGVLAGLYEQGRDRVGAYVAYRNQTNALDDTLDIFIGDLFVALQFDEPSGGRILTAVEVAYVRGTTSMARTVEHPTHDVEQLMAVAQLGRVSDTFDLILEGGYASGDSNAEDGFQGRATIDPDHRVGLILFPEVLAAMSARSAYLASSPELFGRPARGVELIPTNGGVSSAYYLFPHAKWRPLTWFEVRVGAVLGWSSTDVVDPFQQRAYSRSVNYRGGNPTRRDLGLELDGSILLHGDIAPGVQLSGGVEGGVLLPGQAFADASGEVMDPVGLLRLRLGIGY